MSDEPKMLEGGITPSEDSATPSPVLPQFIELLEGTCSENGVGVRMGAEYANALVLELRGLMQPAGAPVQGEACVVCGESEPYTGTCGSEDTRALCKRTQPTTRGAVTDAELRALSELRRYNADQQSIQAEAGNTAYANDHATRVRALDAAIAALAAAPAGAEPKGFLLTGLTTDQLAQKMVERGEGMTLLEAVLRHMGSTLRMVHQKGQAELYSGDPKEPTRHVVEWLERSHTGEVSLHRIALRDYPDWAHEYARPFI